MTKRCCMKFSRDWKYFKCPLRNLNTEITGFAVRSCSDPQGCYPIIWLHHFHHQGLVTTLPLLHYPGWSEGYLHPAEPFPSHFGLSNMATHFLLVSLLLKTVLALVFNIASSVLSKQLEIDLQEALFQCQQAERYQSLVTPRHYHRLYVLLIS